ncbi:MAG: hypothetical protein JWL76_93 [Thermoleophilia bacterium]|nr:hypothetical protein [Thermoleophilia bacterium]
MLHSFRMCALAVFAAVLAAPSSAIAAPPFVEGADVVNSSTAIPSQHVAVVWPESALDVTVLVDADGTNKSWTVTVPPGGVLPTFTPGACTSPTSQTLVCIAPSLASFTAGLELWTGDGSDDVTMTSTDTQPLWAFLRDGIAVQTFRGGAGDDVVNTVEGEDLSGTTNYLLGGRGSDSYVTSTLAATNDYVSFTDGRVAEQHDLSLDCADNDGAFALGEEENIGCKASGMDGVIGSIGNDLIHNSPGGVIVSGGDGSDTLDGGAGVDRVYGGKGNDSLSAGNGSDQLWGDANFGVTSVVADGNDTVNAVDAATLDTVESCGGGNDTAIVDDVVLEISGTAVLDCETKNTGGGPTGSDGYISLFTFGTPGTERVIFDPITPSTATLDVTVTSNGSTTWTIDYTATAPIDPRGPECVEDNANAPSGKARAVCTVTNAEYLRGMEVWLGNGNSTFTPNANILAPFLVHPEAGTNTVQGAAGNDEFRGDHFANASTINTFHGMVGADKFVGGPGLDYVSYSLHPDSGALTGTQEFRMSMDCVANDGYLVDGARTDDVGCTTNGIDGIVGSSSRDVITGDTGDNTLYGGNGNDLIDGGAGADFLKGQGDHDHLTGGTGADRTYGDDVGTTSTGSDTLIVNDGAADTANDCGPGEDAITYDLGLDTQINCENLTPPATTSTTDPTPTPPVPTNPAPTKDPSVPAGWKQGATIAPTTMDYQFPSAFFQEGVTWEGVLLGMGFAKPFPPDMEMIAKPLSFNQLPDKWQDDDVVPQQFIGIVIKSGATPGVKNSIRFTEGQPLPAVEFQYYDATKGAPRNTACPATGEVPAQGGGTTNLFRYVETLPLNDALFWLNKYGCRVDGKPAIQRVRKLTHAGISGVRSVKLGKQRVITFIKNVPIDEELRVLVAPDYTIASHALTYAIDDKGTSKASLDAMSRPGLTATGNTQSLGIHVIEESTGRFVPGARVDLVDDDGKVINWYDATIAQPTRSGKPIGYADKHMRTNDVGFTRLSFKAYKPGTVWVHAWVEDPKTGTPLVERWRAVPVHKRAGSLRTIVGTKWDNSGAASVLDGQTVNNYVVSKSQGKQLEPGSKGRAKATGNWFIDGLLRLVGQLDDNSAIVAGAPGAARAAQETETRLSQEKPVQTILQELANSSPAAKVALWDGGGPEAAIAKAKLIGLDGGSLVGNDGASIVAAGGGNMVAAGGGNLIGLDGGSLVAAGGGNMVAAGGGNMVAAGGGNMVAAGGGNMVAAGGLNMVAAGGLNRYRPGVAVNWLQRIRDGRSAANGTGTPNVGFVPTHLVWYDEDTSVLVGPDGIIDPGTIIHLENRGVPVNYPGTY